MPPKAKLSCGAAATGLYAVNRSGPTSQQCDGTSDAQVSNQLIKLVNGKQKWTWNCSSVSANDSTTCSADIAVAMSCVNGTNDSISCSLVKGDLQVSQVIWYLDGVGVKVTTSYKFEKLSRLGHVLSAYIYDAAGNSYPYTPQVGVGVDSSGNFSTFAGPQSP